MAKINTTNYQSVTAWNGTQDLLIVEQPDGTKVATPEQIRQYMNAFMDDEPTEGSEEAVKSGGIFNAIENSVSLKTATGNPITLTDAANANAEELSMTIEPIQSGSGDPSPTNVRPISGISTATVETTDGTDTNTASIALGRTVYGGSVNFKTGEVTVTHGMVDLGTLTYSYNAGNTRFLTMVSDMKSVNDWIAIDSYCSQYKKRPMAPGWNENNTFGTYSTTLYIRDTRYTEPAAFKTAMSGVQLCYELATPLTLTLTPAELELLKGNNTITANGAEISIEYYPDNAIGALAEKVDDKADITYVDNAVKYTEVTINANTIGHNPPTLSAGGVYYESLVTYEMLGVARDKILNVIPVGWNNITKTFTIYLSVSVVGVFTDSDTSIYKDAIAVNTNLTLRVVYKN